MIRLRITLQPVWGHRWPPFMLLLALVAGLALVGAWLDDQSTVRAQPAGGGPLAPNSPPYFYVTDATYSAGGALSACSDGYHMASLWEIQHFSDLQYAYDHPDAHVKVDSSLGAPANWWGWIRTGQDASPVNTPGTGNCQSWTSTEPDESGTVARLGSDWEAAASAGSPWQATSRACSGIAPVWCVSNRVYDTYLPGLWDTGG